MVARVVAGSRVVCPFQARRLIGVVLNVRDGALPDGVRALAAAVDHEPAVPEDLLAFLRDLAAYYFAPIGEVMRLALPPVERTTARELAEPSLFDEARGLGDRNVQWIEATSKIGGEAALRGQAAAILAYVRAAGAQPVAKLQTQWGAARAAVKRLADLGLVVVQKRQAPGDPFFAEPAARDMPHEPTLSQTSAIETIETAICDGQGVTFLLHGATASGKTEVYLPSITPPPKPHRGPILPVPDISLTPQ